LYDCFDLVFVMCTFVTGPNASRSTVVVCSALALFFYLEISDVQPFVNWSCMMYVVYRDSARSLGRDYDRISSRDIDLYKGERQYIMKKSYFIFSSPEHNGWAFVMAHCPSSVHPSVHPSVNNFFKQHLLWNHFLDFDQTSQEWSLGGPLSKLFKQFQLVA